MVVMNVESILLHFIILSMTEVSDCCKNDKNDLPLFSNLIKSLQCVRDMGLTDG